MYSSIKTRTILEPGAAYDLGATCYDAWIWQDFWRAMEFPVVRQLLNPAFGGSYIDVGCGTGFYLASLADVFAKLAGVDISQKMLEVASSHCANAVLKMASADRLPFQDGEFNALTCCRVITHLGDLDTAMAEFARVLADGGTAVITTVHPDHRYTDTKIPTPNGNVYALTFKHDRVTIEASAISVGFSISACETIVRDGVPGGLVWSFRKVSAPIGFSGELR